MTADPTLIIKRTDRVIFAVFCIIVAFLIVDSLINYVVDLIEPLLSSLWGITCFSLIVAVYGFGQYFILKFIKDRSRQIREKDAYLRAIHRIVTVAQFFTAGIIISILFQILVSSQYYSASLITVVATCQILTVIIMGYFSYRFFSWFRLNKKSMVVLFYGLAFAIDAFAFATVTIDDLSLISKKEPIINPLSDVVMPSDYAVPDWLSDLLFYTYYYASIVSFALLVIATGFLLHHHSKRIGKVKFWVIILLPFVYNLSTSLENLGVYTPANESDEFYWSIYASLNSTAGGILFGFAFWSIAKTIRQDSAVRQYMMIAAYGFVILFISNQVYLVGASYPPFGVAALALLPLSSYMIFLGVYSSAISVSQDNKLRSSIRKLAKEDLNLLSSIGTAQMEKEIQRTVNSMKGVVQEQEKQLEEQTGIEANLEEDEMKNYLEEVMQEVGKSKKPPT